MATFQVSANYDDCQRRLTTSYFNRSSGDLPAGYNGESNKQWGCGMRFQNITIPQGATIHSAHLTLHALHSYSGETVNLRISAEDVDNAIEFADDAAAFDTRYAAQTTAIVDWDDIAGWTAGTDYDSPEIKTVIQEIVNRGSWGSGNAIVIFWEDFDDRSGTDAFAYRDTYAYEESSTYAAKLVITYPLAPTVTTQAVDDIGITTATGHGTITSEGGAAITAHGHCWDTSTNPTTANDKTSKGTGTVGPFISSMTGLTANQLYYVRAYATNSSGTSYGTNVTFTTEATGAPIVTTENCSALTGTTATGNGTITSEGSSAVTQHGHCWNTSINPTTALSTKTENGLAYYGAFTSAITGLTATTTYYIRAYATNTQGTAYGNNVIIIAGTAGSELAGPIAVVQTRFHYVDKYGVERYVEGTAI